MFSLPDGVNPSSFPEGVVQVAFPGVAAYALFDLSNDVSGGQRYIIDNFEGTFGSTEVVPEPGTLALIGIGLAGLCIVRWRKGITQR